MTMLPAVADATLAAEERRLNNRTKFLKRVRVRTLQAPEHEESATLIDLSRTGVYFTVRSLACQLDMELALTMPDTGSVCTCRVVRVEHLPNGRFGIGARILAW